MNLPEGRCASPADSARHGLLDDGVAAVVGLDLDELTGPVGDEAWWSTR